MIIETAVTKLLGMHSLNVSLASGHTDKALRLWDVRQNTEGSVLKLIERSHSNWFTSIAWAGDEHPHLLASGSRDGTLKLWDIRSTIPLCTPTESKEKDPVLDVAWAKGLLCGGGNSSVLQLHSFEQEIKNAA